MRQISRIDRETLEFILGASRSCHPQEFAGVLRAVGDVVKEVLLLPGTLSSDESAVLRLHMLPIDPSACGTVHSHPSPSASPSEEDLMLFAKFGYVHIIAAYPYDERSWKAYNHRGEEIALEVVG
ncbi:MAG: Mov34/MPN/PAD-1 family protein [Candidatus Hodarchaeaceae archaeon]|nr:Mov34/MPN/PAD-1 family protein [Candidatus Hodarchaeaceae archaeon]